MTKNELEAKIKAIPNEPSTNAVIDLATYLRKMVNSSDISKSEKEQLNKEINIQEKIGIKKLKIPSKGRLKQFLHKNRVKLVSVSMAGIMAASTIALFANSNEASAEECEKTAFSSMLNLDKNNMGMPDCVETIRPDLVIPNALPSNLYFDPNDNEILIRQSIPFILNSLPCGIDFTSQRDISNYMDLYIVANIDWLDPMDLSRLGYAYKTPQSIIDGYQVKINEIAIDLLTVTPDTMLSYDFIADKDGRDILMEFQNLIAQYNVAEGKTEKEELAKAIETLLYDNFTLQDGRSDYSHVIYEIMGRFAKSADLILPNGLPKDLTEILCEDLDNCYEVTAAGDKKKSERAEALTTVRATLEYKWLASLAYRNQDLSNVSEMECRTGAELEAIIYEQVKLSYKEFIANPTFEHEGQSVSTRKPTNIVESVTLPNGQEVSKEQVEELGLNPSTATSEQYENAVVQQFEQEAQKDPNHILQDSNGTIVASGENVDPQLSAQGAQDAFWDGYYGRAFAPKQGGSYLAGYTEKNYKLGQQAKEEEQKNNTSSSTYEPVNNGTTQNVGETITEEGYKEDSTNNVNQNTTSKEETSTYEPVNNGTTENIEETITEEGFIETETHFEPIASLSELKEMRAMLDTIMVNPTVYFSGENALFAFGCESYDLSEKGMKM